jgi:glycosyltransferase involved in cell wall biosynthesis
MKKISWFTPQSLDESETPWMSQGFTLAALNIFSALREKQVAVFYNRNEIPFHVNFCQPYYYQNNSMYNVGYTPWESTKIPAGWSYHMKIQNEIWATSNFVKEIFEREKVHDNIYVMPHGIAPEFKIEDREITGKFNFLHVGGDSKRKNAQMAVDAFLELFDGDNDYRLILKYNNFCYAEVYIDGRLVPATQHPQIHGISHLLETEDLVSLYHKCHCMIYPTNGEGFGMIPFEAIATGMPTIVTNATGCKDFAHYSIPLKASFGPADWNNHLYATDTGDWALPDFDDLVDLMQHVVNEYDDFKKYAVKSAKIIHSEYSWSAIADKILARLDAFEKSL